MSNREERNNRIKNQFNTCEQAMREVLRGLFADRLVPPDKVLGDFYRSHKNCGSKDRAFINSSVYSVLRRWGWLREIMPAQVRQNIESGRILLQKRDIAALTAFALMCDGADEKVYSEILQLAGSDSVRITSTSAEGRAAEAAVIFGVDREFCCEQLAPDFRRFVPEDWDYDGYMRRLSLRPPMWIRFASKECKKRALDELTSCGIAFEEYGEFSASLPGAKINLAVLKSFQNGDFEVQDLASQCVGVVCAPKAGERWYDSCAGAGGKSLHLASLMSGKGSVVAGDIRVSALENLKKRARRAGWSNIATRPHDGNRWKGKHKFDGVLVDAPCSGSGVWRRNAALQWRMSEQDIISFAEKQLEILENNAPAVKSGGVLVYATCSIFENENESVARKFLERNPDFTADEFPHPLTGKICCGAMRAGCGVADCDELFAFKMRRK